MSELLKQLQQQNEALRQQNETYKQDLKKTKTIIVDVLQTINVLDKNGNYNQGFNVGSLMPIMLNASGAINKFKSMVELVPILEKYKDL